MLACPIDKINSSSRLQPSPFSLLESEAVLSTIFSPNGALMATVSSTGEAKIFQVSARPDRANWPLLRVLRDAEETELEEFFCGAFWGESYFVAGGKRKNRHAWDDAEGDHSVLPGIVKVFDLKSGRCVNRLTGVHAEEILFLAVDGDFGSLFTCGQDGLLGRWILRSDSEVAEKRAVKAGDMVFHAQIWQNYIFCAVDNFLKVFDKTSMKLLAQFKTEFTSYCDFVAVKRAKGQIVELVLRGVELLNTDTLKPSAPNSIILARFDCERLSLQVTSRLHHPLYSANSWLLRPGLSPNAIYLAAPTITGAVVVFNLDSGRVTAVLREHEECEVRQITFHPELPLLVSCGDDGRVRIRYSCK